MKSILLFWEICSCYLPLLWTLETRVIIASIGPYLKQLVEQWRFSDCICVHIMANMKPSDRLKDKRLLNCSQTDKDCPS